MRLTKPSDYDYKRVRLNLGGHYTTLAMKHEVYVKLVRQTGFTPRQLNIWLRNLACELHAQGVEKWKLSPAVRGEAMQRSRLGGAQ